MLLSTGHGIQVDFEASVRVDGKVKAGEMGQDMGHLGRLACSTSDISCMEFGCASVRASLLSASSVCSRSEAARMGSRTMQALTI